MSDYYDILDKILNRLSNPQIYFPQDTLSQKCSFARYIGKLENETLLLPSTFAFAYPALLAGITEDQINYIAKNAPENYKRELLNSMQQNYKLKEILEITRFMDEDSETDIAQNQQRVINIVQYINDNRIVFDF